MDVSVDVTGPVPPFEQIRSQIAAYVDSGLLPAGSRLPTLRALAADLGVAVGTVARAYTELEAAGMVSSRRRTGTVVLGPQVDRSPTTATPPGYDRVLAAAAQLARVAADVGVDDETVLAVVRAALLTSSHRTAGNR
ncbi:GntR family transcriptional regulator [Modestobacter sp. I12A-02628]|uniref:GntR family transcriptional regulator n=1 Tax=Goekera deserti TaxID=2497753 RepID=A0A7K3WJY1_9ACTN|nr:GntR family transcriptional regulator [Goekera deserti]NDI50579.1 GntR family transcriptional regulator [Goekera deserti]NEL56632.1 GntR family transcriptional regulator [Goekera deserti]